jgi:hypothetical protein
MAKSNYSFHILYLQGDYSCARSFIYIISFVAFVVHVEILFTLSFIYYKAEIKDYYFYNLKEVGLWCSTGKELTKYAQCPGLSP